MPRLPTITIDSTGAELSCEDINTPMRLRWQDYPVKFARFMNYLRPENLQVSRLRLIEREADN